MSVHINLAPELYQQSQRDAHLRRVATSAGIGVSVVALGLLVVGFVVLAGQKLAIANYQRGINNNQAQLATMSDLVPAVTAAAQLDTWSQLEGQKVYMSRFFKILQAIAPQGLSVSTMSLTADDQLTVSAHAGSYALATKFVKALEADNVTVGQNSSPLQKPYFSAVQLSAVTNSGQGGGVDFKLTTTVASEVTSGN